MVNSKFGVSWRDLEGQTLLPHRHDDDSRLLQYDSVRTDSSTDRNVQRPPQHVHFGNEVLIHDPIENRSAKTVLDKSALQFGVRISSLLFISSLFVIVTPNGRSWPQGSWVMITTLMVSWFPSMDAASVIEKSIQRCMGTLFGGFLGLLFGFSCYKISHQRTRVICLEICYVLAVFMVCFISVKYQLTRTQKFITRYSYATSLCLLTLTIAIFPFYQADEPWQKAVSRVMNVAIGSIIGTVGSVVVLPRSTGELLLKRIQSQCQLAGEAAEAILMASADVFGGEIAPISFSEELQPTKQQRKLRRSLLRKSFRRVNQAIIEEGNDIALEKYESAIKEWRVTKGLFSLLRYDPFHYFMESNDDFKHGCAVTLGRALRVQTTVVLMDGIIRNDPHHCFAEDLISTLTEMGTLTRKMLNISPESDTSEAAKELLMERLVLVRAAVGKLSHTVTDTEAVIVSRKSVGSNAHKRRSIVCDDGSNRHNLLFLQLVEHLALRCIALYDSWVEVEELPAAESFHTAIISPANRTLKRKNQGAHFLV